MCWLHITKETYNRTTCAWDLFIPAWVGLIRSSTLHKKTPQKLPQKLPPKSRLSRKVDFFGGLCAYKKMNKKIKARQNSIDGKINIGYKVNLEEKIISPWAMDCDLKSMHRQFIRIKARWFIGIFWLNFILGRIRICHENRREQQRSIGPSEIRMLLFVVWIYLRIYTIFQCVLFLFLFSLLWVPIRSMSVFICLFLLGYAFDKTDRRKDFIPADKIKFGIRGYKFTLQRTFQALRDAWNCLAKSMKHSNTCAEALTSCYFCSHKLLLLFPQSSILIFFILSLVGLLCFDAYSQMLLFWCTHLLRSMSVEGWVVCVVFVGWWGRGMHTRWSVSR